MGIKPDVVTYTSDYFDHLYDTCLSLIKDGHAYADDSVQWECEPNHNALGRRSRLSIPRHEHQQAVHQFREIDWLAEEELAGR